MSTVLQTRPLHLVRILIVLALILCVLPTWSALAKPPNGVDDLRGRWEFIVSDFGGHAPVPLPFDIFINDLEPDSDSEIGNEYLAVGCMNSPDVDATTPMALHATDLGGGVYDLSLLSTAVPSGDDEPFVIQFLGTVYTNGSGVPDDVAAGYIRTDFFQGGEWSGTHHDRRRTHCPPVDEIPVPGLYFSGDVYVHHGYEGDTVVHRTTLLEAYTNIVSSGMRVDRPDGSSVIVPSYTDIFSPHVDFISQFRYLENYEGDPISAEPYAFTLLDALGNPIPGTTQTDVWTACVTYPPPRNLDAIVTPQLNIDLSWDPVPTVPGFDPANEMGFYQIGIWPWDFEGDTTYGASGIAIPNHVIPWASFGGWAPGFPDGADFGAALSELDNGSYQLEVEAFSQPDPANPGGGLECAVYDFAEKLYLAKTDTSVTFFIPNP
jgi:hypothetical protein